MSVSPSRTSEAARYLLYAAATVQVAWFYLACVPSAFSLQAFESGYAPMPFQGRLLMQPLLRWAHGSAALTQTAAWLTQQHAWFPGGVRPEALVELPIDLAAVVLTGWVAEQIYARASQSRVLRGFIYPLTLAMVAVTFDLYTVHSLRFVYDLPAMAVFAAGLYVLYTCRPLWIFALLFLCGTINRETTLLLLPALLLQRASKSRVALACALAITWVGWHMWVAHRFASNVSAAGPRMLLNLAVLLCPLAWPQLATFAGLCVAPLLWLRRHQMDRVLRRWLVLLPLWFGFMLRFGLFVETRVFGELIGLLAPLVALWAEQVVSVRLQRR